MSADLKHKLTLKDDGTLDTVISCAECGEEARYTFHPSKPDTERDEKAYREFIKWALEDFDSEHECQEDEDGD